MSVELFGCDIKILRVFRGKKISLAKLIQAIFSGMVVQCLKASQTVIWEVKNGYGI